VVEVFQEALRDLARRDDLPEEENALNRQLLRHVKSANYRLLRAGRGTRSNIYYEANNQPLESDEDRAARESKRPDFMCGLVDAYAKLTYFLPSNVSGSVLRRRVAGCSIETTPRTVSDASMILSGAMEPIVRQA
jgi:hypothetical protein